MIKIKQFQLMVTKIKLTLAMLMSLFEKLIWIFCQEALKNVEQTLYLQKLAQQAQPINFHLSSVRAYHVCSTSRSA